MVPEKYCRTYDGGGIQNMEIVITEECLINMLTSVVLFCVWGVCVKVLHFCSKCNIFLDFFS